NDALEQLFRDYIGDALLLGRKYDQIPQKEYFELIANLYKRKVELNGKYLMTKHKKNGKDAAACMEFITECDVFQRKVKRGTMEFNKSLRIEARQPKRPQPKTD